MKILKKSFVLFAFSLCLGGCNSDEITLNLAGHGQDFLLKCALLAGLNVNGRATIIENERLFTPLILAATQGHISTVKLLIRHKADPNISDVMGFTPLHGAAMNGHTEIVKLLLEDGADQTLKAAGDTALDLAIKNGKTDVAQVLMNLKNPKNAPGDIVASRPSFTSNSKSGATSVQEQSKNWNEIDLAIIGEKLYPQHCASCHKTDGSGTPGLYPPLIGSRIIEHKLYSIAIVIDGKNLMPPFKDLSDEELAGIVTYMKTRWSKTQEENIMVLPSQIAEYRQKKQ